MTPLQNNAHKLPVLVRSRVRHSQVSQLFASQVLKFTLALLRWVLMIAYACFSLVPLIWMLVSSFSTNAEIFGNSLPFSWRAFVPRKLTLSGYDSLASVGFYRAVGNTFLVSFIVVFGGLLVNSLAGYSFAMFHFRAKNLLFGLVMLTMALPPDVMAIPLYTVVYNFGWIGTLPALIFPVIANGFAIFLCRQAVLGIPRSLIDAARVDGMSWGRIYARIALPLTRGALIGAGLILMIGVWQSFLWPLLVGTTGATDLIQVALAYFQGQYTTNWDGIFAGSVLAIAMPTTILAVMQRYFRPTLSTSGGK